MASVALDPVADGHDALTGLVSASEARRRLSAWSESSGDEAVDGAGHWQVMLIGLPRFQSVNHAYGQPAGDGALIEIAQRVRTLAGEEIEGEWFAARLGGSDFLLAARDDVTRERWSFVAATLADAVARPLAAAGGHLRLVPRLALLRARAGEAAADALDTLSQALADAQRQPGVRLVWADGRRAPRGRSAAALEADLLAALARDEIAVLFQPQFALADGRLTGAEALARWEHPTLGRIGAATLFAVAERADQTLQLSQHIAARALAAAADWPTELGLRLSLNLTAGDLARGGFADTIRAAIGAAGFAPGRLTLEVTEQALLVDLEGAAASLRDLAADGVRVALDDFGAGFANFRYLKLLPLDYLKLDHSLTDEVVALPRDRAILRAIVAMARTLELEVIAEGVESEDQRALLAAEGCDYFQGYLRAKPMGADEFAAFVLR